MDLRQPNWHGQLTISGISKPLRLSGSVTSMLREILNHLITVNPRTLADGAKRVTLEFSDSPIAITSPDDLKALEIESELTNLITVVRPLEGETHAEFRKRLHLDEGLDHITCQILADDAFGLAANPSDSVDATLLDWHRDTRAQRFRQLNSSQHMFDTCDPHEYAELKSYCQQHYASYLKSMLLRG